MRPFAASALHGACWSFQRSGVTRAFSLGLFIAFIPPTPLPVHLVCCSVLGIWFRLNLPVLFATVFLSNPFTWAPQIIASLWVGAKLMHVDLRPMLHDLSRHTLWTDIHRLWAPLLLGSLVLGVAAAASGYLLAQCAWRARVVHHLRRRRARLSLDQRSIR